MLRNERNTNAYSNFIIFKLAWEAKSGYLISNLIPSSINSLAVYNRQSNLVSSELSTNNKSKAGSFAVCQDTGDISIQVIHYHQETYFKPHLTHWGRVTHYGDGTMLCKTPKFFTMKEFPQI